jgi:hypothetical protein
MPNKNAKQLVQDVCTQLQSAKGTLKSQGTVP